MTKNEKDILKEAALILTRELAAKRDVKIPGFGKFYLSWVWAEKLKTNILSFGEDEGELYQVDSVKFRPWTKLKKATGYVPPQKMSIMAARKRA